jgi:hypothetical protein
MDATPDFWTPQELTETELNKICTWLMAWQKACISSDSLAQDFLETGQQLPSQQLDPNFKIAMGHVQSLIRHIRARAERSNIPSC